MLSQLKKFRFSSNYQYLKKQVVNQKVGLIELHRPEALNALSDELFVELNGCLSELDENSEIGCVVITGSGQKAFAAGADIKQMKDKDYSQALSTNMLAHWEHISTIRTPIIAAVNGYALGGGCELALAADIILASQNAKFALPEITLGTIPGCGGTQRLIRQVGKSKAMEMILTGKMISGSEAQQIGLVSSVWPSEQLLEEALQLANKVASFSRPVVRLAKECVNYSAESTLNAGLKFEKRNFHATFALHDRAEGMTAFTEKRKPNFKNK